MTWLTITEYLCNKWPWVCSVCRNNNPVLSPFMTYHRVCNKITRRMPHAGQKLLTLPEHPSIPLFFAWHSGVRVIHVVKLYVFTFCVLRCPLWFKGKCNVLFVATPISFVRGSCFIYVICILMSNTICVSYGVRVA
jgi:hypothetical protein